MNKIVLAMAPLLTISLSVCSQNKKESKEMKATYPKLNWKEGKLLNRVSKQELEAWVKTSVQ